MALSPRVMVEEDEGASAGYVQFSALARENTNMIFLLTACQVAEGLVTSPVAVLPIWVLLFQSLLTSGKVPFPAGCGLLAPAGAGLMSPSQPFPRWGHSHTPHGCFCGVCWHLAAAAILGGCRCVDATADFSERFSPHCCLLNTTKNPHFLGKWMCPLLGKA